MKHLFLLVFTVALFAECKTYNNAIVGRGVAQQGHWVMKQTSFRTAATVPVLVQDSVYYVDITWRQALKTTGSGRLILGVTGGVGGAIGTYAIADGTAAGMTLLSGGLMTGTLALGTTIGYTSVGDCRWNNVREISKSDYWYYMNTYGSLAPFWAKQKLIR